jgi:ubiquinone/menaquinone biosynthesis C-methylase UbiE
MQSSEGKLLSQLEALRAKRIAPLCRGLVQYGQKVLDFGSGSGHIAAQIRKHSGAEITCLDIVDYNRSDLPLVVYDGRYVPFESGKFDIVLLFFVLHHSPEPAQVLREAKRVLKADGKMVILEDIYNSRIERWITLALDSVNHHLYSVSIPFNFKTTGEWEQLFKGLGLTVKNKKLFRLSCPPSVKNIQFVLRKNSE